MANGKFVSYLRVSTVKQGVSGLGLEAQREAIAGYLNGGKWSVVKELVEIESGKRNDRPALAAALNLCRVHHATLVIAKLDRLARNVHFISSLMESGVEFVAVDMPTANRLTVHILAAVAEAEAGMISQRTTVALAAAKARGTALGGLRVSVDRFRKIAIVGRKASVALRTAKAEKNRANLLPVIAEIQTTGTISLRAIAAELTAREIPTSRSGNQWTAMQVSRILARTNSNEGKRDQ
jgi:DNA invertase Pin-like site-specific DNA recombinase